MMAFALPALGIFLVNPLLSNIDNAFVGRTVGSEGLAALSPATLCTDQVLYLFSFLARATTGLVSRAYATGEGGGANAEGAREAASAPLSVSLLIGLVLSGLYAVFTPTLLGRMQVDPSLVPKAASYVYWRGAVAWAALAQACCLQILLATRDALTPLKIVSTAAVLNVVGDYVFCCNPLRWGCAGAAAATSVATLLSSTLMVRALRTKQLLPTLRLPTRREVGSLVEFMGPLMMITITRLLGFVYMQRAASRLGDVKSLAAFQICTNIVSFFLLFGEPLSQLSQTKLPALVDREDGEGLLANLKSVLTLGLGASLVVGGVAWGVARFLTGIFTSDPAVQAIAHSAAPSVFFMVANAIMAVTVDGAMLASKDFGWMLFLGIATFLAQMGALKNATNLNAVFATFIFRLGVYGPLCVIRAAMGKGAIGKAIAKTWKEKKKAALKGE
jgi:putative MATE family efflux protein